MLLDLKESYNLYINFDKKPTNFLSRLYKILFFQKFIHIDINLDDIHNIETTYQNGTSIKNYNFNYSENNITIMIKINKDEYYTIFNNFKYIKDKKYDFFILFKLFFKNKNNIIKRDRLVCTQVCNFILNLININTKSVLKVDKLFNELINELNEHKRDYYFIK